MIKLVITVSIRVYIYIFFVIFGFVFVGFFVFLFFFLFHILVTGQNVNPISTGLFCLVVALGGGGGGVFHPPSITPLSLKLDCSNFVQSYFQIG